MPVSSKALFHFTRKEEYILDIILNKGFAPRYCIEDLSFAIPDRFREMLEKKYAFKQAFPMVCFCDIKLSQTDEHCSMYGKYAIGMTKHWGEMFGITPVQYYHEGSTNLALYINVIEQIMNISKTFSGSSATPFGQHLNGSLGSLFKMMAYMKPVQGEMLRDSEYVEKYFYDEREWRYTPSYLNNPDSEQEEVPEVLLIEQFENALFLEEQHQKLRTYHRLAFEEGDINYIIVPETEQIPEFIKTLRGRVEELKLNVDLDLITYKIRSYEEIKDVYA